MKKVLYVLILCLMCFVSISVKAALPDKLSLSRLGEGNEPKDYVTINGTIGSSPGPDSIPPLYFVYKYSPYNSVNYIAFCTGNPGDLASFGATTYSKTSDWSDEVGAGVAQIIIEGVGNNATIDTIQSTDTNHLKKLYSTQIAIWKYLNDKQLFSGSYESLSGTLNSMFQSNNEMYNGINDLVDKATAAERNLMGIKNFSPVFNQENLNFEKSKNEYVSDVIKIVGEGINSVTVTASEGVEVSGNNTDGYIFSIDSNKITSEQFEVAVAFNVKSNNQSIAKNYKPATTTNQTVTPTLFESFGQKTASLVMSETILVEPELKLSIQKVDENGKGLMGATLKLLDSNENIVKICKDLQNNLIDCKWDTTTNAYNIDDIKPGTYYLYEESAPKGYDLLLNPIVIVVSESGKITADGKNVSGGLIKVSNSLTRTEINKLGAIEGEQLPGAILQILDSDGKEMSCTLIDEQGKVSNNDKCMWNTGKEPKIILGLEEGKYYLTELSAPKGYVLNKNKVVFEVKADGETTEVTMKNDLEVDVPDTLSSRSTMLITIGTLFIFIGTTIITQILKRIKKEF